MFDYLVSALHERIEAARDAAATTTTGFASGKPETRRPQVDEVQPDVSGLGLDPVIERWLRRPGMAAAFADVLADCDLFDACGHWAVGGCTEGAPGVSVCDAFAVDNYNDWETVALDLGIDDDVHSHYDLILALHTHVKLAAPQGMPLPTHWYWLDAAALQRCLVEAVFALGDSLLDNACMLMHLNHAVQREIFGTSRYV